jgi:hypothetical protein
VNCGQSHQTGRGWGWSRVHIVRVASGSVLRCTKHTGRGQQAEVPKRRYNPTSRGECMDVFSGAFLVFCLILLVVILATVLVVSWWTVRARNRARLEMKRHVQGIEGPWNG